MLWALFYVLRVHREVSKVDKNPIVVVSIVQDERDVRYQGECSGSHVQEAKSPGFLRLSKHQTKTKQKALAKLAVLFSCVTCDSGLPAKHRQLWSQLRRGALLLKADSEEMVHVGPCCGATNRHVCGVETCCANTDESLHDRCLIRLFCELLLGRSCWLHG